jgi:nucleotide-binding universal stress UspA family protein
MLMLPEIKNILYATDMGAGSTHVFRYALSLAKTYQAKVAILHVVEPLGSFAQSLVELHISHQSSEKQHAEQRQQLMKNLRNRLHDFCGKEACVAEENLIDGVYVVEGQAAQTIIDQAEQLGADMIVMGTHHHSVVGEALLGTTAHKVLHRCALPTLLVRVPEQDANGAGL